MVYLQKTGDTRVFKIVGNRATHVSHEEAVRDNIWDKIKEVDYNPATVKFGGNFKYDNQGNLKQEKEVKTRPLKGQDPQPAEEGLGKQPARKVSGADLYSNLEDRDGIIYNKVTGEAYSSPEQLAQNLGIQPHEINWNQIKPVEEELPTDQKTVWKDGKSTIIQGSELQGYLDRGYTAEQPAMEGEVINTGSETIPTIEIPEELSGNEFFQQLDDDNKSMISYYWSIMESQDVEKEKKFEEAMNLAGEQAGPYWREKINIMTDEVKRYFGTLDTDLANREKELITRKQRLEDDLLYHSEQFSIEEQAEMSRIKDEYDVQIENTRESMASRGLSASSIKNQAEERLTKSKEDMVGSSQRKYARELRSLTIGTERTKEDLERSVAELREKTKTSKVSTARKAEAYLGSERAGEEDILKPHLAGGISGQLVEDKSTDILRRAQDLMSLSY